MLKVVPQQRVDSRPVAVAEGVVGAVCPMCQGPIAAHLHTLETVSLEMRLHCCREEICDWQTSVLLAWPDIFPELVPLDGAA